MINGRQSRNRAFHSAKGGLKDIDVIDFGDFDVNQADLRAVHNQIKQQVTAFGRQFFGIV